MNPDTPIQMFGIGCGASQPKYLKEKLGIKIRWDEKAHEEEEEKQGSYFSAQDALEILKKISRSDVEMLGLDPGFYYKKIYIYYKFLKILDTSRPENLILTYLPVVPPPVRPSILMDSVSRSEDDLTHQYTQILKVNIMIKNNERNGVAPVLNEDYVNQLQHHTATLMNNEINGIQTKTKSGKPIKSIRERLRGKEGRLRKNLMGKRVDFSARTVITPDPNLALDELGVPRSVALNLTFPETVTPLNIERLKRLVAVGPTEWPGAKILKRADGQEFDLRFTQNRDHITLDIGYIVERHLIDGDLVVFNRQPTLHRMSMMGHRIKILPYSSFRLNLSVTRPYNADFDGDEMNMHVPQTYESKAEIKEIMHVPKQIVSPQSNKPVMGIVQDSLVGIRLMTKRNSFLTRDQVMQLVLWLGDFKFELPVPAIIKPVPMWTGKQIISLLLPEVNISKNCNVHLKDDDKFLLPPRDTKILIEKGELLMGMLDKGVVGDSHGGIVHHIYLDHGLEKAASFLTFTQKIVNNWLIMHGFSVGCSDIFPDEACQREVQIIMDEAGNLVDETFRLAELGRLDHQPGRGMLDSFETTVNNGLNNKFSEASQKAQTMMTDRNNIYNMVASGSKGSNMNIAQIMTCVGQQNVEGKRIPFGFNRRTLPHFTKDDYGRDSKGFVMNSYFTGLRPDEFFFHAMGGREGIIDTAVKTSETGYVQRKLVKALEDIMVKYDGTVRDCGGNIIQFIYGEDGMAGEFIEGFTQNFIEMNNDKLKEEYLFIDAYEDREFNEQLGDYEKYFENTIINDIYNNPESLPILKEEFERIKRYRDEIRHIFPKFDNNLYLPMNITRIIKNFKVNAQSYRNSSQKCDINPLEVIEDVDKLIESLIISQGHDSISKEAQKNGIFLLTIMIRVFLSSKRVCIKENLNKETFKKIIGEIEYKFNKAKVHPGEMVGVICAQSLGEPTTQMTLNTFHHAGISSKNVTLGVPRLKEILNIGKNIKTPEMQVHIKSEIKAKYALLEEMEKNGKIKELQSKLEYTTLKDLTLLSEIYFDPCKDDEPSYTIVEEDRGLLQDYYMMPDEVDQEGATQVRYSSWILRFFLDKNSLIERDIKSLREIKDKIFANFEDKLQIIYDAIVGPDKPVIRIRRKLHDSDPDAEGYDSNEQLRLLKSIENELLNTIRLKGIHNVRKVYLKKIKTRNEVDPTTGTIKLINDYKNFDWNFETDGSNLMETFALDFVDFAKTTSNNCFEVYEVLGIEAGRQILLKEIRRVLDTYNIYVNYRHLTTLCDIMTQRGSLTSVSRHGINRVVDGPFRKASFEQTVEILLQAGVFSDVQRFFGISENIMFGQLCPLGTGSFNLLLNKEFVERNEPKYLPDPDLTNLGNFGPMKDLNDSSPRPYGTEIQTPTHNDFNTPRFDPSSTPGIRSVRDINADIYNFTPAGTPNYSNSYGGSSSIQMLANSNVGTMMHPDTTSPNPLSYREPNNKLFSPNYASPAYNLNTPMYSPNSSAGSPSKFFNIFFYIL